MERIRRRARPSLEGLEGRALLNASRVAGAKVAASAQVDTSRQIAYTAGDGARVTVTLQGVGSLAGSSVGPDGSLNLVYSGTNVASKILGKVAGGSRHAALGSIRDANVPITSLTGVGAETIGIVRLPDFDLVPGGAINLLGGVDELSLRSVGANTQVHLRDNPLSTTIAALATSGSSDTATVTGTGTLDPQSTAFGGGNVGATSGAIPFIDTVGNGQNAQGTPGLSQQQVSGGRSLTYAFQANGGLRLTAVGGTFTPGPNLIEPRDVSKPGPRVAPPGVIVSIDRINGATSNAAPPLGDPQVFGYDPAANTLIRFDAATGAALQTIAVPVTPTGTGGVGLARANGRTLALVGVGTAVLAYDATTGSLAGGFATANLATSAGLTSITGIGTSGGTTLLVDARAGSLGVAQGIDVAASLASGLAVARGSAFAPSQEFRLAGGATGVPGTQRLYAGGSAFFDTFQPNLPQAGILTLSAGATPAETARTALKVANAFVPAAANGGILGDPSAALGSIESNLALVTSVTPAGNVTSLLNPITLAGQGNITLADANPLSDLSESFHPEIAGSALVDVQGNIQSFRAKNANGLVLNDAGNLNLLSAKTLTNSSVVGLPVSHVDVKRRSNASIVSSSRLVGTRGDVTVVSAIRPIGPLSLP
jgi:hypothetical protein